MHDRFRVRFQLHDLLFYVLLVLSFYFTRNTVCSLMMLLFFGYTVFRQIRMRQRMVMPFFCIGILAFILYGAGNILMGNVLYKNIARTMAISLTLNLMMTYAIIQYIGMQRNIPKILHITEASILTTALVVVLLSLRTITSGRLASGTQMNANMLSILCVCGFVLTLYLKKIGRISRLAAWARMAFYLIAVLLTGSRKGLIMVVLAIMVINMAGGGRRIVKTILISAAAAAMIYLVIMNVPVFYNIIGVRVENLLRFLNEGTTIEGSLRSRQALTQIGMQYIARKPWTGYGLDCFKMISGMGGRGKVGIGQVGYYSHNNYIELLFGVGIIGMVLYYIPFLSVLRGLWGRMKKDACIPYLLAILVAKLSVEYAYVSYYVRMDAYILAIVVGCMMAVQCKKEKFESIEGRMI